MDWIIIVLNSHRVIHVVIQAASFLPSILSLSIIVGTIINYLVFVAKTYSGPSLDLEIEQ